MATILLAAAGASIGAGFGGTVLGMSGAVIGRAVGATLGRVIDQRVLSGGSEPVVTGRVDRFRLMGASEGAPIAQVWGRVRLGGQVVWASRFREATRRSGGKGSPQPRTVSYSYSVSVAIALCLGEITGIGRIWADGAEVDPSTLDLRVYPGNETQLPDPKIIAVEGEGKAPAYRGVAYVVIEELDLALFGNRVPQFSFEVIRPAQGEAAGPYPDLAGSLRGVCLIPGTGEYALATTPVHFSDGPGANRSANVHTTGGRSDFTHSLEALTRELPQVGAVSLVVSWFGSDLRCGQCTLRPKVEQTAQDGVGMPWVVSGLARADAQVVPLLEGRSVYGGTPADASVIEAIRALREAGKDVTFYPFILMDQLAGNALPDPWTGASGQPTLPWRGRITLSSAPGQVGSPDRTAAAAVEVAAFFGTASPAHFGALGQSVTYNGPNEWSFRRFILHYAKLCALAGGVEAFCIGSELRGLTQIRAAGDSFPTVDALRALAADVRVILGPATKISYAADWSEYFGYHAGDNVYFHLDPLWSDTNIDFIGIDNYLPLSDWRDGADHADAGWGAIHNLDYLASNVAGGEYFDWYYDGPEGEAAQLRKPITDGDYNEPWVYRPKDLRGWWSNPHFDRIGGVRSATATGWVPRSKPIRFTEYGCAAIDKGTNHPNRFLDPKSSESALPRASNGARDDLIQLQYYAAHFRHWSDPANNPVSSSYGAPMLDLAHSHGWAWDARPFPAFPANTAVWGDGANYEAGHWLNGRTSNQPLAGVIAEICARAGVTPVAALRAHGMVRGYLVNDIATARAALQPLLAAYGVEAMEREGELVFANRDGRSRAQLLLDNLVAGEDQQGALELARAPQVEMPGRVRLTYIEAERDFAARTAEAVFPDMAGPAVAENEMSLVMTDAEAFLIAERWMAESRVARDSARFALPISQLALGAGDVVTLDGSHYRIDRLEVGSSQRIEAARVESGLYIPARSIPAPRPSVSAVPSLPVYPLFLDLPLITGVELPDAPHLAVSAAPWPGAVAVWSSDQDDGYVLNRLITSGARVGVMQSPLRSAPPGLWDRGGDLVVKLASGTLASASEGAILNGANLAAIGDGSPGGWEVFQFQQAELIATSTYALRMRLRGQLGTDATMPAEWPVGSFVVMLDTALAQIALASNARGLERHYRVGAATSGYNDPAVWHGTSAFEGIGLRPLSVAHLACTASGTGGLRLSWVRRTRIDGDGWLAEDVPLGETREAYRLRVRQGTAILREVEVTSPQWLYNAADIAADGASGTLAFEVAQLSDRFGPGPFRSIAASI